MRELFLDSRSEEDCAGKTRAFDYAVLIDEVAAGPLAFESYGVKITERGRNNFACVANLTSSASRIEELMTLLIRNIVTPGSLMDVVGDWL